MEFILVFLFVLAAFLVVYYAILVIGGFFMGIFMVIEPYVSPELRRERKEQEKKEHERERQHREEAVILAKEQQEYNRQITKERYVLQYQQLRKEIEAMPQYEHWRQAVFQKFGRKCAVCGSVGNLEVDHRYMSFYAIIQKYGITNVVQAYECMALWDVNNGAPLCKTHHGQTKSSMYRNKNNPEVAQATVHKNIIVDLPVKDSIKSEAPVSEEYIGDQDLPEIQY